MADAAALPFAEALYEAALAADRLDAVHRDLAAVRSAVEESPDLARFLRNPAFPAESKRRVLESLTARGEQLVSNFLNVLLAHGRLDLLVDAAEAFADRYRREQRELAVSLTTAVPIDDAQADSLRQQLESATGQTVTIRRTVDPSIVGGVVLRVRDLLVDASVRRRLEGLRLLLKASKLPSGGEA
jgi:ATP synthase F1 delta subunit